MLQSVSVYITQHQRSLSLCFAKITMLTLVTYRYLKLIGIVAAGNSFQRLMVLFTEEYFPISVLCLLLLIFLS